MAPPRFSTLLRRNLFACLSLALALLATATSAHAQAPVITAVSSPRQVVTINQNLTLTVTATGATSYQWKRNGLPISGATNASYTLTAAKPVRDNGWYQALATNATGSTTSAVVFVNVTVNKANVVAWGYNVNGQTTLPSNLTSVVAIEGGVYHSLALKEDGTVVAWGWNGNGQTDVPAGLGSVVAVDGGVSHSVALRSDGTVSAWGYNGDGQATVPAGLSNVVMIRAGYTHCLALKSDGTVVPWGSNDSGQAIFPAGLSNVVMIASGHSHNLALKADGTVVAWGSNSDGQATVPSGLTGIVAIAAGDTHSLALRSDGTVVGWGADFPSQSPALAGVVAIASGSYHSLALKSNGSVVAWGANSSGQTVVPVALGSVEAIASGGQHSLVLRNAAGDVAPSITTSPVGRVANRGEGVGFLVVADSGTAPLTYQWRKGGAAISGATASTYTINAVGADSAGSYDVVVTNYLGTATSNAATLAVNSSPVVNAASFGRYALAPGQSLTLTLDPAIAGGATVQWRRNGFAVSGATARSLAVTNASRASGGYYQAVYSEGSGAVVSAPIFVLFAPATTQIVGWGSNGDSQISGLSGITDAVALGASTTSSAALRSNGTVVTSGSSVTVPSDLGNVVAISGGSLGSGGDGFLALKADGTVVAWGSNYFGQTTVPAGLSDVVSVAWADTHSLAVKRDGTVVTWGSTAYGTTAVPAGLTGVVAVAGGSYFSLALKSDGTVVGWGLNNYGQSAVPSGLTGVIAIAAGARQGWALKSDGTVVGWGQNESGVLTIPSSLSSAIGVAASGYYYEYASVQPAHALALKGDGTVTAWGGNGSGQNTVPIGLNAVFAVAAGSSYSLALRDTTGDLPPTITTQPASVTAFAGQDVTLAVGATAGNALLNYQWRKGGVNITGATAAILLLPRVTTAAGGNYDVVVSNQFGSVTSQVAALTFNATPAAGISGGTRQVVNAGQSLTLTATTPLATPVTFQWRKDGRDLAGATNTTLAISSAGGRDDGAYQVVATNASGSALSEVAWVIVARPSQVVAYGYNSDGQINVPAGLTTAVQVAVGELHSLALRSDGTVAGWGDSEFGQRNVPSGLTNVVRIAAGRYHSMALRSDGTVITWGKLNYTPSGLANVIAVAGGDGYAMALKFDGTIVAWDAGGLATDVPAGLKAVGIAAGAAGDGLRMALKPDGTLAVWRGTSAPSGLANVVSISAATSGSDALALRADGTVVTWGYYGQEIIPSGLNNVVAIAAGYYMGYAVKSDGTVVSWGTYDPALGAAASQVDRAFGLGASNHVLVLRETSSDIAPSINAQPVGGSVSLGGTKALTVGATGGMLAYQWRFNGGNITGATSATYTITGAQSSQAGAYDVVVSNYLGTATSTAATLVVGSLPSIFTHPASQTVGLGGTASLSYGASGTTPMTIQWSKGGSPIAGATNAVLTLANFQGSDAGDYTVRLTNSVGSATSLSATLTAVASNPPVIGSQPVGGNLSPGNVASFFVSITSGSSVSYQWRKNGVPIAGATGSGYILGQVALGDSGLYDVVITSIGGSVTSDPASLNVSSSSLAIAAQPVSVTVGLNGTATFSVSLSGVAPFSYQWRKVNSPISGATDSTLTIPGVQAGDAGAYNVVVTSALGTITSNSATLTVITNAPVITTQPMGGSTTAPVGATVSYSVAATGTLLTYQWRKDGGAISGATSTTLTLAGVQLSATGVYDVVVSNPAGSVTSIASIVNVTQIPAFTSANNAQFVAGVAGTFTVSATGFPTPTFFVVGGTFPSWAALNATTGVISGTPSSGSGSPFSFTLQASTGFSSVSQPFTLTVNTLPVISGQPVNTSVNLGFSTSLFVSATGTPAPTFQWRKAGVSIAGATNTTLSFSNTQTSSAGDYDVVVTNSVGVVTSNTVTLTVVILPPAIATAPVGGTIGVGGSHTLSAVATGSGTLTYQWRRDGVLLPGATASILTLANAQSYDNGDYTLVVTSPYGTVTTVPAHVTVVARAVAVSARLILDGDGALAFFTVEGATSKQLLLRAVGPGLTPFGIPGLVPDPKLDVFNSAGTVVASNNDWGAAANLAAIASTSTAVGAFGLAQGSRDAAILQTFAPGAYTVRASGNSGIGGLVYLELFDADLAPGGSTIPYLAVRSRVSEGFGIVIGGLTSNGRGVKSFLLRAIGPALGIPGAFADPALLVVRDGTLVANNDNWDAIFNDATAVTSATARLGAFALPAGSRDAAQVVTGNLHTGAQVLQVAGPAGARGLVLVELHDLEPTRPVSFAPTIVSPPLAQAVAVGATLNLVVLANGTAPLSYQWRKDGLNLSGATAPTLSIASAQPADGGIYSIVVTNAQGAATSLPAPVTVQGLGGANSGAHAVVGTGYFSGGTVVVTNTLTYADTATSLGWSVTLPVGWSFAADSGSVGDTKPSAGDIGTIAWAWTTPPPSPVTFSYTLNVPAAESGERALAATAVVRVGTSPLNLTVAPSPLIVAPGQRYHTADTDQDSRLNLVELTRVIELYNTRFGTTRTGRYRIQSDTEDGFGIDATSGGAPATLARYHSADSNRNASLSLVELTRVIELFNVRTGTTRTGAYRLQSGTEDGYGPSP